MTFDASTLRRSLKLVTLAGAAAGWAATVGGRPTPGSRGPAGHRLPRRPAGRLVAVRPGGRGEGGPHGLCELPHRGRLRPGPPRAGRFAAGPETGPGGGRRTEGRGGGTARRALGRAGFAAVRPDVRQRRPEEGRVTRNRGRSQRPDPRTGRRRPRADRPMRPRERPSATSGRPRRPRGATRAPGTGSTSASHPGRPAARGRSAPRWPRSPSARPPVTRRGSTNKAVAGLRLLRDYLRRRFAEENLFNRLWIVEAATVLEGLLTADERREVLDQLLAVQREDGGWALATFGGYKRVDRTGPGPGFRRLRDRPGRARLCSAQGRPRTARSWPGGSPGSGPTSKKTAPGRAARSTRSATRQPSSAS